MSPTAPQCPTEITQLRNRELRGATHQSEEIDMKLANDRSCPMRLNALPHPTRNPVVFDRLWIQAWILPIPRIGAAASAR